MKLKKSIFYIFPALYIFGLKKIHDTNFYKRYEYMSGFAKQGDLVLEPACGPAILSDFLQSNISYKGFDTNKDFINYALKKNKKVFLGNVLDLKNYRKADLVVICDVLHHLKPEDRKKLITYCYNSATKFFIICEPGKQIQNKKNTVQKFFDKINEWVENDGTIDFKNEYYLTKDKLLEEINKGFEIIPNNINRQIEYMGEDVIVVYKIK